MTLTLLRGKLERELSAMDIADNPTWNYLMGVSFGLAVACMLIYYFWEQDTRT